MMNCDGGKDHSLTPKIITTWTTGGGERGDVVAVGGDGGGAALEYNYLHSVCNGVRCALALAQIEKTISCSSSSASYAAAAQGVRVEQEEEASKETLQQFIYNYRLW